jgi:hypothetical protein
MLEHVEPLHRLRELRDPGGRAWRQLQPEDGDRGRHEQHRPAAQKRERPPHDRRREPVPQAGVLLGAKPLRQEGNPRYAAPAVEREQSRLQRQRRRNRGQRNQEATDADRSHERERNEQEQR